MIMTYVAAVVCRCPKTSPSRHAHGPGVFPMIGKNTGRWSARWNTENQANIIRSQEELITMETNPAFHAPREGRFVHDDLGRHDAG